MLLLVLFLSGGVKMFRDGLLALRAAD